MGYAVNPETIHENEHGNGGLIKDTYKTYVTLTKNLYSAPASGYGGTTVTGGEGYKMFPKGSRVLIEESSIFSGNWSGGGGVKYSFRPLQGT